MTIIREATRRVDEDIANEGVPPQENQTPPHEHVPLGGQALVNPTVMTYSDVRATFLRLTQVMYNQTQSISRDAIYQFY